MWRLPHGFQCVPKARGSGCFFHPERILRDTHQLGKQAIALQSQQREDLAIDLDPRLVEPIDEAAVRHAELAGERVDARDPQRAIIALVLLAIAIGVGQAFLKCVTGLLVKSTPADEAGGEFELSFMSAAGFW